MVAVAGEETCGFWAVCSEEVREDHEVSDEDACGYLTDARRSSAAFRTCWHWDMDDERAFADLRQSKGLMVATSLITDTAIDDAEYACGKGTGLCISTGVCYPKEYQ